MIRCSRSPAIRLALCSVPGCASVHTTACSFLVPTPNPWPRMCGAMLCNEHRVVQGEDHLCPAHARHVAAQAAEVTP